MMENENLSTEACVEEKEPPKLVNGNEESAELSASPLKDEGEWKANFLLHTITCTWFNLDVNSFGWVITVFFVGFRLCSVEYGSNVLCFNIVIWNS